MDRKQHGQLRPAIVQRRQGIANIRQRPAETLAAMGGDQQQRSRNRRNGGRGRHRSAAQARLHVQQRVDDPVADDMDETGCNALAKQIVAGADRRREMPAGETAGEDAVHLLWKRLVEIVGAEPGLDVGNRNPAVEGRQGGGQHRRRVPLDDDVFPACLVKTLAEAGESAGQELVQRLVVAHQLEVHVGRQVKGIEGTVQQRAVLT